MKDLKGTTILSSVGYFLSVGSKFLDVKKLGQPFQDPRHSVAKLRCNL
jgi:hypothetical protein